MLTATLSLAAALGYTLHDVLITRVVRAASIFTALAWVQLVGLVVFLPLMALLGSVPSTGEQWRAAALAAATGPLEVLALATLLQAFATGKLSVVAPLAALSGGFGAALVIALGEPVSTAAWVGLPLAVVGGLLASIERVEGREEGRRRATAGAGWALLCAVLFGMEPVLFGRATEVLNPVSVVTIGRASGLAIVLPLTLALGGLRLPAEFRLRTVLCGLFDAGAFIALAVATAIGPVSTASVLVAQCGAMTAVVGLVGFRERLTRPQLVGVGVTVVAVTLLAIS